MYRKNCNSIKVVLIGANTRSEINHLKNQKHRLDSHVGTVGCVKDSKCVQLENTTVVHI